MTTEQKLGFENAAYIAKQLNGVDVENRQGVKLDWVIAADALLRSQAEQIETLTKERDALAADLKLTARDRDGLAAMTQKFMEDEYIQSLVKRIHQDAGAVQKYDDALMETLASGSFNILAVHDSALVEPLNQRILAIEQIIVDAYLSDCGQGEKMVWEMFHQEARDIIKRTADMLEKP